MSRTSVRTGKVHRAVTPCMFRDLWDTMSCLLKVIAICSSVEPYLSRYPPSPVLERMLLKPKDLEWELPNAQGDQTDGQV